MERKYLRMIRGMAAGGERGWSVYVLRCGDETLYTGIAKDVALRLEKHNAGKGAAYTRTHLPVALLYERGGLTRSEALIEEARIKALRRAKKEDFIRGAAAAAGRRRGRRKKAELPSLPLIQRRQYPPIS